MKKISIGLIIGMIIGTLYYAIFKYNSDRILTYLAVIPILCGPLLLRKTSFKLNDKEKCCYYVFVFIADFLGCVANLYNVVWWYDIFVHFISGIFTFMVGLFILDKINVSKDNFCFKMLFCIGIVALGALLWELFEFSVDNLLGMNLQHNKDTGVNDTMIDILVAFVGGILSIGGCYIASKKKW